MTDPYKVLGVTSNASDTDIKKAYRNLAKKYHPDRTGGDKRKETRFKDISAAYEILSDPNKKSRFDTMSSGGGIPMDGNLSDIFAQMFGGSAGQQRAQRRQPAGGPFGGMGGSPFGGMGGSPFGGMGGSPFGDGQPRQAQNRPVTKSPPKEKKIKASDGSPLILKGKNIYSDLRIPFDQAIEGVVANVPTRSGSAKVTIPPGTSSGQKLRLKGKGVQSSNRVVGKGTSTQTTGDHFVTVHIDVPKVEGKKSRDLLVKLVTSLEKDKGKS